MNERIQTQNITPTNGQTNKDTEPQEQTTKAKMTKGTKEEKSWWFFFFYLVRSFVQEAMCIWQYD